MITNPKIKAIVLEIPCPLCGKKSELVLQYEDFKKLTSENPLITSTNFPNLSTDERELLISGICSDCWDKELTNKNN